MRSSISEQRKTLLEDSRLNSPARWVFGVPGWRRRRENRADAGANVSLVRCYGGGPVMRLVVVVAGTALLVLAAVVVPCVMQAGEAPSASGYSLLSPLRSCNLTVFPVVASKSYDTAEFLTLDEGLQWRRSGHRSGAGPRPHPASIGRPGNDSPCPTHSRRGGQPPRAG